MKNVFDEIQERIGKILEENEKYRIKNLDGSALTKEIAEEVISKINGVCLMVMYLKEETDKLAGFCSYYPDECIKLLQTMKTVFEMELEVL